MVVEKLKEYKNKEQNFRENYAEKVIEDFKQCIPESLKEVFEFANVCVNGYLLSANVKVGDVHFFMFYHYDKHYYEMVFANEVWTSKQSFEELVDCILKN